MPLAPGTLLNNRYRIISILGQGGMGAVYRASDEHLLISVALKENLFLTEEYSRQFQREAHILAGLRHPNLPHVSDYFSLEHQGQYLVMDYVEGEDLRQWMEREGALPERETILIGISICEALDYLHNRQPSIVHRDIKPGNIKVTADGHAVLVDFGLAKIMQSNNQATSTGARAMTPGYSPPEQYGTARTDARSDIYSLGATLYAALTGVIPEDSLARMTGKAELSPIRELAPRINKRLAEAIEKALEVDPDDRFQNALDFRKALVEAGELSPHFVERPTITPPPGALEKDAEGAIEDEAIQEWKREPAVLNGLGGRRSLSVSRKGRKLIRSSIPIVLTVIFSVILIFGIMAVLPSSLFRAEAARPTAEGTQVSALNTADTPTVTASVEATSVKVVETTPEPTGVTPTESPTPTLSPTPSPTPLGGGAGEIAFTSNRSGSYQIWLTNREGTARRQITNMSGGSCQGSWAPDGMRMVFISPCPGRQESYPGAALYILNMTDGSVTPLPSNPQGDFDPAWSPDGKRIAFTSLRKGYPSIFIIDIETQAVQDLDTLKYNDRQPMWAPGGMQLAFIRQNPTGQIWLMDDSGGYQTQFTISVGSINEYPTWSPDGETIYFTQSNASVASRLTGLTYEDRRTLKEFLVPAKPVADQGPISNARMSPDGFWFVYESWNADNYDVYVMKANGTDYKRLTKDPGVDYNPTWRPSAPVTQ